MLHVAPSQHMRCPADDGSQISFKDVKDRVDIQALSLRQRALVHPVRGRT